SLHSQAGDHATSSNSWPAAESCGIPPRPRRGVVLGVHMDKMRQDFTAQTADDLLRDAALLQQTAATPPPASIALDPELIGDFILESREHLAQIESQLLTLERDASDSEALHAIFRGFHTI